MRTLCYPRPRLLTLPLDLVLRLLEEAGRDEGRDAGRLAGLEVGRVVGLDAGRLVGLDAGRLVGLEVGRLLGLDVGRVAGLEVGRVAELEVGLVLDVGRVRYSDRELEILSVFVFPLRFISEREFAFLPAT